jgi:hypothetical protein
MKNIVLRIALLAAVVALGVAPMAHAQIYLSDTDVTNFTGPITSYAMLSNFSGGDVCSPACPATFPSTSDTVKSGLRVFGGGSITGLPTSNNWILATFSNPVSTIVVFPNMDHFPCWDGYQYAIQGSNDLTTWTLLFDPVTVPAIETGSDDHYTNGCKLGTAVGSFSGTAPLFVNNVVIPCSSLLVNGACPDSPRLPGSGPSGSVGYEAFFDFGKAYKYYAFGASTVASTIAADNNPANTDQELSAVGTGPAAVTVTLRGNGVTNAFPFPFATYNVIYPADVSIPANTTMTISPNVLAPSDCTGAINIPAFSFGEPTCTMFTGTTPTLFSVIYDVACSANGAPSTSAQCPRTTGFDPFVSGAVHSSEDISNILAYSPNNTPSGFAPQMLTAPEGSKAWVPYGVGFQFDCCTRGSGGSNYNSMVVAADFPATVASTFGIPAYNFVGFQPPVSNTDLNIVKAGSTIPLKWCLSYPTQTSLGFNGGPVTNLTFPPIGYLSITATPISAASVSTLDDNVINTQSNAGLLNLGGGCYNFGWATRGIVPGKTYQVNLNVGDGQPHTAMFQFK